MSIAQKHIDNVLDIKDEDMLESGSEDNKMVKSKTMPTMKESELIKNDEFSWGSFNGSFFETSKVNHTIVNPPPPRKSETSSGINKLRIN